MVGSRGLGKLRGSRRVGACSSAPRCATSDRLESEFTSSRADHEWRTKVSARDCSTLSKNHNDKWFYERSPIFSGADSSGSNNFALLTSCNLLNLVLFYFKFKL